MPNVRPITIDELDKIGVDGDNRLYWDKKPVVTKKEIRLPKCVNISIILGGLSTLAIAFMDFYRIYCKLN